MDVAFVGGGAAALWLACLAQRRGLSVAVIAPDPLGGEQTLASQGIIHGGGKYLLRRNASRVRSEPPTQLATMPARWRRCVAGDIVEASGDVDVRGLTVLAEHVELRATTRRALPRFRVASRMLAAGPRSDAPRREGVSPSRHAARRVPRKAEGPAQQCQARVRLPEDFVVDAESLVKLLAAGVRGHLLPRQVAPEDVLVDDDGVAGIRVGNTTLLAQRYVFAAGAGNAELARRAGLQPQATVSRPLHQAWARIERAEAVFAHCLTRPFGAEPDLTITTHPCDDATVLYLGGRLATIGVARDESAQKAAARRAVAAALPHIDTTHAEFHTLRVDRAEPQRTAARRASDAFLTTRRNASLCFPVKLSLMPRLGDLFLHELAAVKPDTNPWCGNPNQPVATARRPWS